MTKIMGNIVGLPSPRSDWNQTDETKADFIKNKPNLSAPKQTIKFTNGIRIEAEEGLLSITDTLGNKYTLCLDEYGIEAYYAGYADYAEQASYAEESDYSNYAGMDVEGRTLKGNEIVDEGDTDTVELSLTDGFTFRYGIISDSLIVYTDGDWAYEGLDCALYFTTPSVMPENYSQFIGNVCFKGDSVDDRAFVPEKNTRYTIYFDFDGNMVVGYVSGVPAPSEEDE